MIGLDTGYFFRLAEKTGQSIELLHTAMEEERDVVVCTIAIYELLRHRAVWMPPSSTLCSATERPSAG